MTSEGRTGWAAALRGGFSAEGSLKVAVAVGGVVVVVVTAAGMLYLDNLYGPVGDHPSWAGVTGLVSGVVPAALASATGWWVARRSRAAAVLLVAVVCAGGWVLLPRQIDVSESWRPQPNARWSCTGWSFRHYPPGTMDGDSTTYCVGLETRIPDG